MDRIVNRDSTAIRTFSSASENLAGELAESAARLFEMIQEATGYMQDEGGKTAIEIVLDLLEEICASIHVLYCLVDQLNESARLLDEADLLL